MSKDYNPCKTCEHWRYHSRKADPEPMNSISYHYCEMQSYKPNKKKRLEICNLFGYYKKKEA